MVKKLHCKIQYRMLGRVEKGKRLASGDLGLCHLDKRTVPKATTSLGQQTG